MQSPIEKFQERCRTMDRVAAWCATMREEAGNPDLRIDALGPIPESLCIERVFVAWLNRPGSSIPVNWRIAYYNFAIRFREIHTPIIPIPVYLYKNTDIDAFNDELGLVYITETQAISQPSVQKILEHVAETRSTYLCSMLSCRLQMFLPFAATSQHPTAFKKLCRLVDRLARLECEEFPVTEVTL